MPPMEWPTTIGFLSFNASSTSSAMQGDVEHVAQPILACRLAVARQERRHDAVLGGEGRDQRIGRHVAARPVEIEEVAALSGFDDLDADA